MGTADGQKPKIRIFVSCHKNCDVVQSSIFAPVHVGTALAKKPLEHMLHDNTGDNISDRNKRYCELTAQYWAWKNEDADYYGFFHYRRYFSFNTKQFPSDQYNNVFYPTVLGEHERDFCLNEEAAQKLISQYDMIVPYEMDLSLLPQNENTVYKHYKNAQFHHIEDYDFCCEYIQKHYPDYADALQKYNNSSKAYFLNMYIMRKELFFSYCEWLFPMLDAFDKQHDYTNDNIGEARTPGFLAERLFGVWLTKQKQDNPNLKIHSAQTSMIRNTDPVEILPAFAENNVAVCLGADNNYMPFAGLVISSIVQNSKPQNNYDIIVFSNGITQLNQDFLLRSVQGISNVSVRFFDSASYLTGNLGERDHINRSTYLRFIIPKALCAYPKAVYLDCDLVVVRDIADLYNVDLGDNYLAAVRDTVDPCWIKNNHNHTLESIRDNLGLTNVYDYFNAGVLVLNIPAFNALFPTEELFALAQSRRWVWQDQDLLNHLCKGHTLLLEQNWNVLVHLHNTFAEQEEFYAPVWLHDNYMNARKNPYIVHYCGRQIPCFCPFVDLSEYFWKFARNSAVYEIILNYAAAEYSYRPVGTPPSFFKRAKRLFNKGIHSLQQNGFRITWEKTCSKLRKHFKMTEKKNKKYTPSANISLLRKASLAMLKQFDKLCKATDTEYWLTVESLFSQAHEGGFLRDSYAVQIGILREDMTKLQNLLAKQSDWAIRKQKVGEAWEYVFSSARFTDLPLILLYPFDRSEATADECERERAADRIDFYNAVQSGKQPFETAVADFAAKSAKGGKTLRLGTESNLFGYAAAFDANDIFPTKRATFENLKVRVPNNAEQVLKRCYLGWKTITAHSVPVTVDEQQKAEIQKFL